MYLEERFEKEKAESIEGKRKEEQKTVSQEIDSTIFHLCDMIRNSKLLQHEITKKSSKTNQQNKNLLLAM